MELTNEQRTCLGLELTDPSWERTEILNSVKPELATGKVVLYFEGDTIRKTISIQDNGSYRENKVCLKTEENRTMISSKTGKGKPKRLNAVNLQRFSAEGMYFSYGGPRGYVRLANYTTQQTYFSSYFAGLPPMSEDELQDFLAQWAADTDDEEFARIQAFAGAKRRHCKYREGDFFRFRIDRRTYGYGRILFDVMKFKKSGGKFWDILMGRPLAVSVYHIITEDPSADIAKLEQLKSCPSQFIMDNVFFYGEYEIIGNAPLTGDVDYPVMYGRSISHTNPNKIMYQRGPLYRELPLDGHEVIGSRDFKNNGIGWSLDVNKNILEACIEEDSNAPYWCAGDGKWHSGDIRNPKYGDKLAKIMAQMEGG